MVNVRVIKEVMEPCNPGEEALCFQWCEYIYKDKSKETETGYRFIRKRPNGSLQAARGQARIPSVSKINELMQLADEAGWLGKMEDNSIY